jgi:hypothetical protein
MTARPAQVDLTSGTLGPPRLDARLTEADFDHHHLSQPSLQGPVGEDSVAGTGAIGRTHQMVDVVGSATGPDAMPQAAPASRLGHQGQTRQGH